MSLAFAYDVVLFDLDGVIYRGDRALPFAPRVVEELRNSGKRVMFVTNNSSRPPEEVAKRLADLEVAAEPNDVVTSALATADVISDRGGGSVFVIGMRGILDALEGAGVQVVGGEPDRTDYVVLGLDEDAHYAKLRRACLLVDGGARLIATNADPSLPVAGGLWPGAGALLAVITTTTGATPEVIGKPNAPLFRAALKRSGGSHPLVVGDRLDTDIAGAAGLGWDSLLVFTGVTRPEELRGSSIRPTYTSDDLSVLLASGQDVGYSAAETR